MVESGIFYSTIVDPLLKGLRGSVANQINEGEKVIDIACGTGAQVFAIKDLAASVTGVDLSESMVRYATKKALKEKSTNTHFMVANATDLSAFYNTNFDVAILSMALHQFDPELQMPILNEIMKIAGRIIVLDYAVPLPRNYVGFASKIAEFFAGTEHNRNFKKYTRAGGLNAILPANGLKIQRSHFLGKSAFQLVVAK